MTSRARGWLANLVVLGVAALLLAFALRDVAWSEIVAIVSHAEGSRLAMAALALFLSFVARAARWRVLLRQDGTLSHLPVFESTMVGYLGNSYLPARAGDLLRVVALRRWTGISRSFAIGTTVVERLFDAAAIVGLALVLVAGLGVAARWLLPAVGVFTAVLIGLCIGILVLPRTLGALSRVLTWVRIPAMLRAATMERIDRAMLGLSGMRSVRQAGQFAVLTPVVWALEASFVGLTADALGLSFAVVTSLLLVCALALSSAIPSTPGFVGVYQFVAVTALTPLGYSASEAIAYILVYQGVAYAVVTVFGVPALVHAMFKSHASPSRTGPDPGRAQPAVNR